MLISELLQAGLSAAEHSVIHPHPATPLPRLPSPLDAVANAAGLEFTSLGRHCGLHTHRVAPVST